MRRKIPALIIVFILLGAALAAASEAKQNRIVSVTAKQAAELIDANKENADFIVLDIRTSPEFRSGHLPNAMLIDFYSSSFVADIRRLDKSKIYLVYCRSGNRSGRALPVFEKLDFQRVYHMYQGIIGWKSERLRLSR